MRKLVLLIFCYILLNPVLLRAQEADTTGWVWDDSTETQPAKHSKNTHKKNHLNFGWHSKDFDFCWDDLGFGNHPFIEVQYGITEKTDKDLLDKFNGTGAGVLKLGYQDISFANESAGVLKMHRHYAGVGLYSKDFYKKDDTLKLQGSVINFGFNWDRGYGYGNPRSAVLLYNSFGIGWSRLKVDEPIANLNDLNELNRYHELYKFSIKSEGGLLIQPIPFMAINLNYERNLVYPRVLFWHTAGSLLSEAICHGLVGEFVDKILESTPAAAPIINFVLQNGISYGFSELRKENMNFPFGDEAPLMMSTFKVGLTMTF